MRVTVGTFNLNNLFSRYNFQGEIDAIQDGETGVDSELKYEFGPEGHFRIRTFQGGLVNAKDPDDIGSIAQRILSMDVDVLAVQEVEHIDVLRQFNRENLGTLYPFQVLVEGNDQRLIDVGILSKLPLGGITSWQAAVHPDEPGRPVFSRDLLEVEVLNASRTRNLLTIFNNHLKSKFVPFGVNEAQGQAANDLRRRRQAQTIARIVKARTRPDSRYIVLGDMNDTPDSEPLEGITQDEELGLMTNALTNPTETRPPKADTPPPPASGSWTHRFKESGQPARYELLDQIWLSPALADRQMGAFINRRTKHGGDGSDHDPAWIELEL